METGKNGVAAERIRSLLALRKMKQSDLAREAGLTCAAVSRYVSGGRIPKGVALLTIARALGTTTEYLKGETDLPFVSTVADDVAEIKLLVSRSRALMTAEQKCDIAELLFCGGRRDGESWQE